MPRPTDEEMAARRLLQGALRVLTEKNLTDQQGDLISGIRAFLGYAAQKPETPGPSAPAPDLYAALGLMEHVKNVVSGSLNYHKAAVEWITEAKEIVAAAANAGLKDELHAVAEEARVQQEGQALSVPVQTALADVKSIRQWMKSLGVLKADSLRTRRDNALTQLDFIAAVLQDKRQRPAFGSDEPDVSTDAIEGILLTNIGSNATLPADVEVVGFDNAANALATLFDEREQWVLQEQSTKGTDDVVVPHDLAKQIAHILKYVRDSTSTRYISNYDVREYVRPFDDLVHPKKTRTFHVEVTGTKFQLEQVLSDIRQASQKATEASISEDTE